MLPLFILKTGESFDQVRDGLGDFDGLFQKSLEEAGVRLRVIEVYKDEPIPSLTEAFAAIITGSSSSVTRPESWVPALESWTRDAVARAFPILGVCYGHQLLAKALGGEVVLNPRGYEVGTVGVDLTEAGRTDALLGSLSDMHLGPRQLVFHATHQDAVTRLPEGAVLLATNAAGIQSFSYGAAARGVQFHPEFSEEAMRLYVERRAPLIRETAERRGEDPDDALLRVRASVRTTPIGKKLLRSFVELARASYAVRS